MKFLYNIFVLLLFFGMKIGSVFNKKLKKGLEGRKRSCDKVKKKISPSDKVIWMHAASLGEYEQGLPVLERLKEKFPGRKILVTFFSPSGYEIVAKKNTVADVVCYLPFDRQTSVREFVSNFQPEIFFTVKYDFWYNLLGELKRRGTKIFVVSALFYEKQLYFKPHGKWFTTQLSRNVDWFFHQTAHSCALANQIGLLQSSVSGDTRFDRVKQILQRDNQVSHISNFKQHNQLLVFGSSWEAEEQLAKLVLAKDKAVKIIIAPHDLNRVPHLQKMFPDALIYSRIANSGQSLPDTSRILIIDSIGLLSKLYSYADIAVVGGGFHSKGLHNILEAAVFGIPVIFGSQYRKNPEADALIAANGAKAFANAGTAASFISELLQDPAMLHRMGTNAADYVAAQPNASQIVAIAIQTDFTCC